MTVMTGNARHGLKDPEDLMGIIYPAGIMGPALSQSLDQGQETELQFSRLSPQPPVGQHAPRATLPNALIPSVLCKQKHLSWGEG